VAGVASAAALAAVIVARGTAPALAGPSHAATGQDRGTARAAAAGTASASTAATADSPAGFWNGTDSSTIKISGSPYQEPGIGGVYGGYIGMTGNWANYAGCHKIVVWSAANARQANANFSRHDGIGSGAYWFMGGPGVDPNYNGRIKEAYDWGERQASRALADVEHSHLTYPVIFMDIEIPGDAPNYTPAPDNGWNSVYTSACSGVVKVGYVPVSLDRADFNGFAAFLTKHSKYKAGVYSALGIWKSIFGTGTAAAIPNTYEWTYESFTSSLAHPPARWCLSGSGSSTCATFFGGITSGSKYALMWQWTGGGGSYNGYGDLDQIDGNRTP
jgi:hypothetical protein